MIRLVALGLLSTVIACGGESPDAGHASRPAPESIVVSAESVTTIVPVEGTVQARRRAEIATRLMARITEVAVDVGSRVTPGQTLLRLGTEDIAANRTRAEAAAAAARAARDEAARHARRMDTLLVQDAVAEVQRDQARLALEQANAQLAQAEAALRDVETAASYSTLRAPFAGTVVARNVDPGDIGHPGVPLVIVEDDGPRDGVLYVPIAVTPALSVGDSVLVETVGAGPRHVPIRAIAEGADAMTRSVEVRVRLPESWPTGAVIRAGVPAGRAESVLIPLSAVVRRGQLTGVRVVDDAGSRIRWVRLGRTIGDQVEVLSGLRAGERIAS